MMVSEDDDSQAASEHSISAEIELTMISPSADHSAAAPLLIAVHGYGALSDT